jgi:hypothetical protein
MAQTFLVTLDTFQTLPLISYWFMDEAESTNLLNGRAIPAPVISLKIRASFRRSGYPQETQYSM